MRMKLPKFTLIGATTKFSKISQPLKDRFGFIGKLVKYTDEELEIIVKNSANKLKILIEDEAIEMIASHSRNIPRIANNLLKRSHDFAIVKDVKTINKSVIIETFSNIGLYKYGLTDHHLNYLKLLAENFEDKWTSLDSIIGMIHEERGNIEKDIEPVLLMQGLIEKGPRGRKITTKGVRYTNNYNLR